MNHTKNNNDTSPEEVLLTQAEGDMNKVVNAFEAEIAKIRAGRVHPDYLNGISVECYGVKENIKNVALIKVPEANQLLIVPHDPSLIKEINKSLQAANLKNVTVQAEATGIRLRFPDLTQDVRKSLVKEVNRITNDFKVNIRNVRQNTKKHTLALDLPKDVNANADKALQILTDKYTKIVDDLGKTKEHNLLDVNKA